MVAHVHPCTRDISTSVSVIPGRLSIGWYTKNLKVTPILSVSKTELKAKMLEYFRRVEQTGEEIIVTNNRVPVLKVSPLKKIKALRRYLPVFR